MHRGYRSGSHILRRISITLAILCVVAAVLLVVLLQNIYINDQNIKVLKIPFTDHVIALENAPFVDPSQIEAVPPEESAEVIFLPEAGSTYQERIERSVLLPYHMMFDPAAVDGFLAAIKDTGVNTVILEAKPASGNLAFVSSSELAGDANAASNDALLALKTRLNTAGYSVVASVSCFRDNLLPRANEDLACKNRDGVLWVDTMRYTWMDPYLEDTHVYLITLISDLYKLGFTEIVLTNLSFPNAGDADPVVYEEGRETLEEKEARIDQFLLQLGGFANGLTDLSLAVRYDGAEGQTAQSFVNFFYRIYLPLTHGEDVLVDTAPITELNAMLGEGTLPYRLVPIISLAERPALEAYEMLQETVEYGTGYWFDSPEGKYDPLLFQ